MKIVALVLIATAAGAQPDLSGTWTANREKSSPGGPPPSVKVTLTVEHSGDKIRFLMSMGERTMSLAYTIGGEENSNTMHGFPLKSRARWEGAALVVDSIMNPGPQQRTTNERWILSADGKTLSMAQTIGDGKENTIVFDRSASVSPAEKIQVTMKAWNRALGVECTHCHIDGQWTEASMPPYKAASRMKQMTERLQQSASVSCWTCHRGALQPPMLASERPSDQWPDGKRPASDTFQNLQMLKEVPPARMAFAMNMFSASLGVDCSHCHVAGEWDKDDKMPKQTARRMFAMVRRTLDEFYGGRGPVTCYTCHRGKTRPE